MDTLVGLDVRSAVDPGSTPGRSTILSEFAEKLAAAQVDLDPELARIINDNFWDLL
jgi:hypothetical protein